MNLNNPKSETKYDVNYFIKRFRDIPEDRWTIGIRCDNSGRRCAHGHCYGYVSDSKELAFNLIPQNDIESSLFKLATRYLHKPCFASVNNGGHLGYQQPTPKQRVLAALYDIKRMQEEEEKINYRTVLVEVDEKVKKLTEVEFNN